MTLCIPEMITNTLCTLSTNTTGELDVLGHDGDAFGMDSAQVGILKQTHQVSFTGLLQQQRLDLMMRSKNYQLQQNSVQVPDP